jgi:hypothetical protein
MGTETPKVRQMTDEAVALIREWRTEVAGEWTGSVPGVDSSALGAVLLKGESYGIGSLTSLVGVLRCEWLYRARRATPEDIEAELWGIRNGLSSSLKGALTPDQAALVVEALRPGIDRQLRSRRYLVSLGTWAVPVHGLPFRWSGMKHRPGTMTDFPVDAVKAKRGPIPKVGPILAAVLFAGLLERTGVARAKADPLGTELGSVLLGRSVLLLEFRAWKAALDRPIPDPLPSAPQPELRSTVRLWLIEQFRRDCPGPNAKGGWVALRQEMARDPKRAFTRVGDDLLIARVYGVSLSDRRSSKKGAQDARRKS